MLTARREREAAIYRLADDRDEVIASEEALMPQEVEPESSLAKSKIAHRPIDRATTDALIQRLHPRAQRGAERDRARLQPAATSAR